MEQLNKYGYRKITSEEIYNEEYKKWKKKFNEITFKKLKNDPDIYLKKFEDVMREGAEREVISFEFADKKIKQLYRELTAPQRFSMDMREKKDYVKRKAKEYFKKNKNKKKK